MQPAPPPSLYTISAGTPFLPTLAEAFLSGRLLNGIKPVDDPLLMSQTTIFLPTRRAVKAFSALLSASMGEQTLLLPRLIALGDNEENEDHLLIHLSDLSDPSALLPEADPLFRTLTLAQLIMQWKSTIQAMIVSGKAESMGTETPLPPRHLAALQSEERPFIPATTPQDALALAQSLGRLIDTLTIHDKGVADLHAEIPSELAEHWQITRSFLQIAVEAWPAICADYGVQDSARRRHHLLTLEAARLQASQPTRPMIVAGSTGSMPATAALIRAIARLPRGCVVLPGIDTQIDEASLQALQSGDEPGHPQHLLMRLVKSMDVHPHEVIQLGQPSTSALMRERLIQEAMRPASTTHFWASHRATIHPESLQQALEGMTLIEAEDEREEALAIALAMRAQLETPTGTAALITPDRSLAERVSYELARWSVHVDDSSGLPLRRALAGRLLLLLVEWLSAPDDPHKMLALLDHPMVRLGLAEPDKARGRTTLDVLAMRGLIPDPSLAGLAERLKTVNLERLNPTQRALYHTGFDVALSVLAQLQSLYEHFIAASDGQTLIEQCVRLEQLLEPLCKDEHHLTVFERPADRSTGVRELARLFDDIRQLPPIALYGAHTDLAGFLEGLMQGRLIPPDPTMHPRLRIWGLLEARLLPTDRVILGGCDEGVWPPLAETDAFINRPIAKALGLPSPEQRLGQTAHDFCQAMGVADVLLTRSSKRKGDPVVRSRFLQRLQAVIGQDATRIIRNRGQCWLDWARALDQPEQPLPPIHRPSPTPPPALLPKQISVTEITTLRRDPYAIYARRILKIDPLDAIHRPVAASDLGSAIHDALGQFTQAYPHALPSEARTALLEIGQRCFATLSNRPEFVTFWWPRYLRIIEWFLEFEQAQRQDSRMVLAENPGRHRLDLSPDQSLIVHGRADRITLHQDGCFSLYDFKTGRVPTAKEVLSHLESQLTISAALVEKGGFEALGVRRLRSIDYIKLGGEDGGTFSDLTEKLKDTPLETLVQEHWQGMTTLFKAYWVESRGFTSRLYPPRRDSVGPYDHLARVKEWSLGEQDQES